MREPIVWTCYLIFMKIGLFSLLFYLLSLCKCIWFIMVERFSGRLVWHLSSFKLCCCLLLRSFLLILYEKFIFGVVEKKVVCKGFTTPLILCYNEYGWRNLHTIKKDTFDCCNQMFPEFLVASEINSVEIRCFYYFNSNIITMRNNSNIITNWEVSLFVINITTFLLSNDKWKGKHLIKTNVSKNSIAGWLVLCKLRIWYLEKEMFLCYDEYGWRNLHTIKKDTFDCVNQMFPCYFW